MAFAEDVDRHNTNDKIIVFSLVAEKRDLSHLMFGFKRLSGDIVSKAANSGIPILILVVPALNTGIDLAKSIG